ncbi:MAG TPA: tetratricopeptide repeat protein, partial [Gemmataceae bacterium]|nr:tetratricopeptide repeat protein [Gemmataceae bacterium]
LQALTVERYALLIGVREGTKELPSFVHAEPDAEVLARALQFGGFKADKVAVLTQTRGVAKPDDMPTADNIKQRLRGLAANGSAADILVVVLIGHVVEGPGGAYFCPAGANLPVPDTLVSLADVLDALAAAPPQKKLLVLDCWRKDWKNADKLAHVRTWDKTPPPGVTILYACAKGQTGLEHPTSWHGVFNHYLIQGLLGEAAQPQVTGALLANYCRHQVSKLVADTFRDADQVPVLASNQGGESWTITSPGATTADYLLGCARLETQAYEKAIEAFNRAEPNLPGFVELYLRRAEGYYRLGEFDRVMMDCRVALNLDSNNADAYASQAESQAAKKDFISAGKSGAKAVDLDPQCALAFDALGSVYRSSQDYDSAVKYITSAINLQPELYIYYHHRGLVYRINKQWDNAIADFSEAIRRNDHTAILYADRGNAWRQKKNPKLAIQDYSQAIKLNASVSSWWLTRGTLRIDGDLDNAIVDLDKATKLKDDYTLAWFNLGYAYSKKQMYPLAIEALNKALQLEPNYPAAKKLLKEIAERK